MIYRELQNYQRAIKTMCLPDTISVCRNDLVYSWTIPVCWFTDDTLPSSYKILLSWPSYQNWFG